jgi:hypothetical protein
MVMAQAQVQVQVQKMVTAWASVTARAMAERTLAFAER